MDVAIADAVAEHTTPRTERLSELLSLAADEHLMLALAAGWWLCTRRGSSRDRVNGNHILLTTVAVSLVPHVLKSIFDQRRPDRLTVRGHLHGVPVSGKPLDAFPSGHAMHVGALASAATVLPSAGRNAIWALAAGLGLTRIVLLAHWASDVVVGLALGAVTERLLRRLTGYGASRTDGERPPARQGRGKSSGGISPRR